MTENGKAQLVELIRAYSAEIGIRQAAEQLRMSDDLLRAMLHGKREISAATADKFGWERVVIYRPVPAPAAEKETGAE